MRKFNLRGTVVERMMGIERKISKPSETKAAKAEETPDMNAAFIPEQGLLSFAWRTDIGCLRKNNQDTVILGNGLVGVADGMGGHKGGEIASAGLRNGLLRETKNSKPDKEILQNAVCIVNRELWEQQEADNALSGMGTTLTVIWPTNNQMIIGQVGDSRAYLLREGMLKQMTEDHSMVADMVRKGVLTEEQAACHPMRNYITRAIGTEEKIDIDISIVDRKQGDRWLVCSDGLYGMVTRDELLQMMMTEDIEEAADKMLQTALDHGGKDNISLVLLQDDTSFSDEVKTDIIAMHTGEEPSEEVNPG